MEVLGFKVMPRYIDGSQPGLCKILSQMEDGQDRKNPREDKSVTHIPTISNFLTTDIYQLSVDKMENKISNVLLNNNHAKTLLLFYEFFSVSFYQEPQNKLMSVRDIYDFLNPPPKTVCITKGERVTNLSGSIPYSGLSKGQLLLLC